MTSDTKIRPHSKSLVKQGLLLVSVFLLYEIGFIGTLAMLLSQTEKEAAKQEFARELSSKADRLMLILYDRGDAVGRYARSLQIGATDQSDASVDEVTDLLAWLKSAFNDRPDAKALVEKIDQQVSVCLPLHAEISKGVGAGQQYAHREWEKKTEVVQPIINQLIKELPALVRMARSNDNLDVEGERQKRQQTEKFLIVGLILNFAIVIAIAYLFSRRITSRLDVLTENTQRLRQGKKLNALIGGEDEIATVDAVFHATASRLRDELAILKNNEQRVRALLENLPVGIVLLDTKGTIEMVNSAVEETLNYSSHHLLGARLQKIFVADQPIIAGAPHSAESQVAFKRSVDLNALDANRKSVPVEFSMSEVLLEGESKTLAVIADATEKLRLQKMRQDFVAMVRSELKFPLTNVSSFLQKFGNGELGEVSEQCMVTTKSMEQNIDRLILLLNDLFDLDKLEQGQIEVERRQVLVDTILQKSVNAVSVFAMNHKIDLQVPKSHLKVLADENRVVQVLVNLLSNAIKFSPQDSVVEILVDAAPDSISADGAVDGEPVEAAQDRNQVDAPPYIRLRVRDTGAGIPDAQMQTIFEPYKQVDGQDPKKGGTGLGLAICKTIIEAHDGGIGVDSKQGQGSTFWFTLPLSDARGGDE